MNLINPSDTRRQGGMTAGFVDKAPLDPNEYSVAAHGGVNSLEESNGNPISAEKLAALIKADPNYDPSKPVRLNACKTGGKTPDGSPNYAQQLATALGNTVYAPTDDLHRWSVTSGWSSPYLGDHTTTNYYSEVRNGGSWQAFR